MKTLSIKVKIAGAVALCLVAIAVSNAVMAGYNFEQEMRYVAEQAVRSAGRSFAAMEQREVDKLSTALDALLGEPTFAAHFSARDRERLLETAAPIFKELKARHHVARWYFIDAATRTAFLRVHRPELHGDVIDHQTLLTAIRTGETASGRDLGKAAFALRVARPFVVDGKTIGYVELGQEIDDFLVTMKAETGDDFALAIQKRYLDEKAWVATRGERRNNWGDDPEMVIVDQTKSDAPIAGTGADLRDVPEAGWFLASVAHRSSRFVRGVVPVLDSAGQRVGGLFVLHDVTARRDRALSDQLRVVLLIGGVAVVALGLLFVLFEVLVFRRLGNMMKTMHDVSVRLAGGDYDVGATIDSRASDEIGSFERFLGSFLLTIGSTLRELEKRRRSG